jgi:hypothetical protein
MSSSKTKELVLGEQFTVMMDPLSRGGTMTYLRCKMQVTCRQSVGIEPGEEGVDFEVGLPDQGNFCLDIAVSKIIHVEEVDDQGGIANGGGWGEMSEWVGKSEMFVRGSDEWMYAAWPTSVDFVE